MGQSQFAWRLLQRRDCVRPTWRGWLLLLVLAVAFGVYGINRIYPFLAVTQPVGLGVLVVEGWAGDDVLAVVCREFAQGRFSRIYVTGGPIPKGAFLAEYDNFAQLTAMELIHMGVSSNVVQAVPAPAVATDRTYAAAVALREWLRRDEIVQTNFNVITIGPHARRTRLLFEKALGKKCRVGIMAIPDPQYDPNHWWRTSAGFRNVTGELLAYVYARLFFHPADPSDP